MRTGLIVEKLGMSSFFTEFGERVGVTLLRAKNLEVVGHRTFEKNGYDAVIVGFGAKKASIVSKPMLVAYSKNKIKPKLQIKEFRISNDAFVEVGSELNVAHFVEGQLVDVTGISIGKGFAGAMKRHNFGGLEATHGVSISHRSHGSTGGCQDPGRVFKNKKMAGQLGNKQITRHNLEVMQIDIENNIIIVKGSVPGARGTIVTISDAVKSGIPATAPHPTSKPLVELKKDQQVKDSSSDDNVEQDVA